MTSPGGKMQRSSAILTAVLVPIALLAVAGMAALWPSGPVVTQGDVVAVDTTYPSARVIGTAEQSCEASAEDRLADGSIPATVDCLRVTASVTSGAYAGREVKVWATARLTSRAVPVGTHITLEHYPASGGDPEVWAWHDFARTVPLGVLALIFAAVTIAVAGLRGLRALIGLGLASAVIAVFMLPALLAGENGLLVGLTGSTLIMFVVLYLAHGPGRRTSTALVGTLAGLALTAGLGAFAASVAHLSGVATEDDNRLAALLGATGSAGLRGVFLCGLVLAGLGVLNDVTITQASAVWELSASRPDAGRRELFASAMRIGRDHIASTVYTIAFAYAGASLPVLLLLEVYQLPVLQTVTGGAFAEEIVRTLAGSIGLVLAIPLTTVVAVLVVSSDPRATRRRRHRQVEAAAHLH